MNFIYSSYFKHNPYPSLILIPEDSSSYKIYDANDAFIDLMQVDKASIVEKDIFESFLSNDRNVASVVSSIMKTSLAYVKTFWIPRKIEKLPIVFSDNRGVEKEAYWDIYNCPVLDDGNNLKYLLLIAREVKKEELIDIIASDIFPYKEFQNRRFSIVLRKLDKLLNRDTSKNISYPKVFQIIGDALKIERLYYYKVDPAYKNGGLNERQSSRWIEVDHWASKIQPCEWDRETIKGLLLPLSGREEFSINVNDIADVGYKKLFVDNGIKSLCILPIFLKNEFHGILGVEDCVNERVWSPEEKDFMKCVISLLAAAIEK